MMEVELFITETFVECFCTFCECNGMSEDEISDKFFNEQGDLMHDDRSLIKENATLFDDVLIFEEVYNFISALYSERNVDIKKLVSFLASKFYLYNYYLEKDSLIKYIERASLDEIVELFLNNEDFGTEMVKAYFYVLVNEDKYMAVRELIYKNNKQDTLFRLEALTMNFKTINEILRSMVCNLYNNYISNGCSSIEALNMTWEFFLRDFDPLEELEAMGVDKKSKAYLRKYLLSLIYADLYEDVANDSIIQSANYEDRLADVIPMLAVTMGIINIPREEGVRNRLLQHFILLQDEKEKMMANRKRTYDDKRINILKKVNPTYILDELTFSKN